jgi:hypothetical protein
MLGPVVSQKLAYVSEVLATSINKTKTLKIVLKSTKKTGLNICLNAPLDEENTLC